MKKTLYFLTALLVAFPGWANMQNNELNYASTKDIRDINPHLYSGEMAAQNMVFEPLVVNTEFGPQRVGVSLLMEKPIFLSYVQM